MFSWAYLKTTGILSSSVPQGCLWGFLEYPKGSALELLDGTLKLRHCTDVFTTRFPPWSGIVGGKRQSITPGHLLDEGSNTGKTVQLTRKTRHGALVTTIRIRPILIPSVLLNLLILCPLIAASGLGVFFGMVGCLVSMALVLLTPGLLPLVIWLLFISSCAWVLILLTLLIVGLLLTIGMLMILPWKCPSILIFGLMGAGKAFLLWVGLKLLVLVFICLLQSLLLRVRFGERQKSMVMLDWSVVVLFCLSLGLCKLFSVLSFGVLFLLCRLTGLVIWN